MYIRRRYPKPGRQELYAAKLAASCQAFADSGLADPKFTDELVSGSDSKFWSCVSEALLAERLKDKDIEIGGDWRRAIDFQLEHYAEAAVLLVSPAYLASDFIRSSELPVLLRRRQQRGLLVIPIVLRHCFFAEALFSYPDPSAGLKKLSLSVFQAANPPTQPLDSVSRSEQDAVFTAVGHRLLAAHAERARARR